jgi:hypothetical protein
LNLKTASDYTIRAVILGAKQMSNCKQPSLFLTASALLATIIFLIATGIGYAAPSCNGTTCSCAGDKDCNDMFTNYCKETGGSCDNAKGTCTCTQKASASISEGTPPKKAGTGAVKPVKKGVMK